MAYFITKDVDGNITGLFLDASGYSAPPAEAIQVNDEQGELLRSGFGRFKQFTDGSIVENDAVLLAEANAVKISQLEKACDAATSANVDYMSTTFQADEASRNKLNQVITALGAIGQTPPGFYWTDSSNNHVLMTYAELQGFAMAMLAQGWGAFDHLQQVKTAARAAASVADVEVVVW